MNKYSITVFSLISFALGVGLTLLVMPAITDQVESVKTSPKQEPVYWVAPMDASYRRDKPGKSPMGMDLVPVYQDQSADMVPGTVTISPSVEQNLGVKTGKVAIGDLDLTVDTIGYIRFNENRINHFHSRVEGWIESLAVTAKGDPVAQGQKLYELYSPDLVNAQEEFLAALNSRNNQLLEGSERKLISLGITNQLIDNLRQTKTVAQRLPFYANQAGYVSELNVREGSFIKPATNVLSVGALNDVWVIAEIFERQASWVKKGQQVEMTTESYPEEKWSGVVDYLYPELEPRTRTLRARIVFDNADLRLKPNMFAQLIIRAGEKTSVITIPRQAVIYQGGMKRVVKSVGNGKFRSTRIETGIESGELIEVISGLDPADVVVISGQFLIDSESNLSADLMRIEADPAVDDEASEGPWVTGELVSIMPSHNMISVHHEPITEWGWPAMNMDFTTSASIDLQRFSTGQLVGFRLFELDDGSYLITEMKNTGKPSTHLHPPTEDNDSN
jgi:Cu(I)/Ag(I) efflux system membrane fusion protein